MLETRSLVRREADRQKKQIMETFETMRKRGKIDPNSLQKLGINIEIKEDPKAEDTTPAADIQLVKDRQNKELRALLEAE